MDDKKSGFGTFKGVYIPNMLGMFGVIMYLRLGFISAHIGVAGIGAVIGLSLLIMVITGLSVTSIVTNMRVGDGGAYYIISRSLGIEIGAALGMSMYLCQLISISMCVAGFSLSFHDIYPQFPIIYIQIALSTALLVIAYISSDLTLKAQILIFGVIIASLVSIFTGSMEHVSAVKASKAVSPVGFWEAFAVFFPAVTGIEAGMALSGTLKNPSRSLSVGTLGALASAGVIYLGLAFFILYAIPTDVLINNPLVLQEFASVRQLVIMGIWGSTISCALGCVLGAPRILQALAEDGVLPRPLAKTYGPRAEPRTALLLTYCGGLALVLTTEIDQIIPILTMICLISYGMLNFVSAFADLIHHPSWRPTFRTPWYVSFLGSLACLMVMLMIDSGATFIAIAVVIALYIWVSRKKVQVPFEDVRDTIIFYFSRLALYRLSPSLQKPKNWHLNLLAFAPSPFSKLDFVHFVGALTNRSGLLTFTSFVPESWGDEQRIEASEKTLGDFFAKQLVPCIVEVSPTDNLQEGVKTFMRSYGMGRLQPNTIALCCPRDEDNIANLVPIIQEARSASKNVIIFRGEPGAGSQGGVLLRTRFQEKRQVDIWWNGDDRNNFSLLLFLANILQSAPTWKNTQLALKVAVGDELQREKHESYLRDFTSSRRLDLDPHVTVVPTDSDPHAELASQSANSDLVLIGLRDLGVDEPLATYEVYLEALMEKTKSLRNIAFVMACGNVAFKEVYSD